MLSQRTSLFVAPFLAIAVTLLVGEVTTPRTIDAPVERRLRELEQRLDALRSRWNVPGMSATIASGTDVIWARRFGTADRATGRPATADTVYQLVSLTKPFAAAVLFTS